jgi:RES domain-containing protein
LIHRPELLDALQQAPSGPLETQAWRHMFGSHQPDRENTGGARWNPPGVAAIYLSCGREGAIAEGDHAIAVQPLMPRARRFVYVVEIQLGNILDLSDANDLHRAGLTEDDLADDDHSACREVGAAIDWLEHDGLLIPSARSDAKNLVIYPAHRPAGATFSFGAGEEVT